MLARRNSSEIISDAALSKGYYRQAVALQCMGRHAEALAAYASALARNSASESLLESLVDAALKSHLGTTLQPQFEQLQQLKIGNKVFTTVAIIGQELLASDEKQSAITVLESALRLETKELSFKGSVYSALSSAYWRINNIKRALHFMNQDLLVAEELDDDSAKCRVHGNLGNVYYADNNYDDALHHYQMQLNVAYAISDKFQTSQALSSLGHVYVSLKDYQKALKSHKRCALVKKDLNDKLGEAKELGNVGNIYAVIGDFDNAVKCQKEYLRLSKTLGNEEEICHALNNLGNAYQNMSQYDLAVESFTEMFEVSQGKADYVTQCQALSGLGHLFRIQRNFTSAERCHEQQLKIAIDSKDYQLEASSQVDLGVCYQQKGDYDKALEYHRAHLASCRKLADREGESVSYGNIGNAYQSLGEYKKALKYHQLGLLLVKDLHNLSSEATFHGNVAVALQSLQMYDEALEHYQEHLAIAKSLDELKSISVAQRNLGNYYLSQEDYREAVSHYEKYLSATEKLSDTFEKSRAFHKLAYASFRMKQYHEAIEYYEKNISLANDVNDTESLGPAYCYLGLSYSAIDDHQKAVRCTKLYLASSRENRNAKNICNALGNLGMIYIKMGDDEEGVNQYLEKVRTAEKSKMVNLQADAYHELVNALKKLNKYADAIPHCENELKLRRQMNDPTSLYKALSTHGEVLEKASQFREAYNCYCEMFRLAKRHKDMAECQHVCKLMGTVNMRMKKYEKAISAFHLQLEYINGANLDSIDAGHVHVQISDCYFHLDDIENVMHHLNEYEAIAKRAGSCEEENYAYKKFSDIYEKKEFLQEALIYAEKRLGCIPGLNAEQICSVYKDLASLHAKMGKHDSAISYYKELLNVSQKGDLAELLFDAHRGLGDMYTIINRQEESLHAYINAMELCDRIKDVLCEVEVCVRIGNQYRKLGRHDDALTYYENALSIADESGFKMLKGRVNGCLGKLYHTLGNSCRSKILFAEAIKIADDMRVEEERIIAHYRFGLFSFYEKNYEKSRKYFQHVIEMVEQGECSLDYPNPDLVLFIDSAYQMLQMVLILLEKPLEALFVAEKANCLRIEGLLQKTGIRTHVRIPTLMEFSKRLNRVNKIVIAYSIVADTMYCWLILPGKGLENCWTTRIVSVKEVISDKVDFDDMIMRSFEDATSKLNEYVNDMRESLGVGAHSTSLFHTSNDRSMPSSIDIEDEKENIESYIEPNADMIANPIAISISTEDQLSPKPAIADRDDNSGSKKSRWQASDLQQNLYDILLLQVEEYLEEWRHETKCNDDRVYINFVIPKELSLIVFGLLKGRNYDNHFHERFNISFSPSLFWILDQKEETEYEKSIESKGADNVFVYGTNENDTVEEVIDIARILNTSAFVGSITPKSEIIQRLRNSTVCHLSTNVLWRLPALEFPYNDLSKDFSRTESPNPNGETVEIHCRARSPLFADTILSLKEICEVPFNAKLLAFGIAPPHEQRSRICRDGLIMLSTALLMTGCKTLLTSHWTIPGNARKYFFRNFYNYFNKGVPAYTAFSDAIRLMQKSDEFKHPSNWSGFVIYGQNSRLHRATYSFHDAIYEFLSNPSRDVIKVILHLVEKARQRLAQEKISSMYIAETSIVKKMPPNDEGWRSLLVALGFRFEKAHGNMPDSIFFPTYHHLNVLNLGSNTLHAFLGLNRNGLEAISRLRSTKAIGKPLVKLFQEVLYYFNQDMSNVQVPFPLALWKTRGCHEFLATLGFDVMGVGKEEVMLRSGKNNFRRNIHCALQSVKDLFEITDAGNDVNDANDVNLLSNTNKVYSPTHTRVGANSPALQPVNNLTTGAMSVNSSMSGEESVSLNGISPKSLTRSKNYLHSQVGLFGSRDCLNSIHKSTPVRNSCVVLADGDDFSDLDDSEEVDSVFDVRNRGDTDSPSSYGIKRDNSMSLNKYLTTESKAITSSKRESCEWDSSARKLHSKSRNCPPRLNSSDAFSNDSEESSLTSFKDDLSLLSSTTSDVTLNLNIRGSLEGDIFSESYLSEKRFENQRLSSSGSRETILSTDSAEQDEDPFIERRDNRIQAPRDWNRLNLDKTYFNQVSSITMSSISDSLNADSKSETDELPSDLSCFDVSKPPSRKNSLDRFKKRNWFQFLSKKKWRSLSNLSSNTATHDYHLDHTFDSPLKTPESPACKDDKPKGHRKLQDSEINRIKALDHKVYSNVEKIYYC